jgi:hypothetical protein
MSHTSIDHDVCHLFEHLVIRSFRDTLKEKGYHPGLIGGLDATTHNDSITFLITATDRQVITLFQDHLDHLPVFSKKLIEHEIGRLGSEDSERYSISDFSSLLNDFEVLRQRAARGKAKKMSTTAPALGYSASEAQFLTTTLIFSVETSDPRLQLLFALMSPFILDIVYDPLVQQYPIYTRETSSVMINEAHTQVAFAWQFNHPGHLDNETFLHEAEKIISEFDITPYLDQYHTYAHVYALRQKNQTIRRLSLNKRTELKENEIGTLLSTLSIHLC